MNKSVQPQEMARGLKFQNYEDGLNYLFSENKDADPHRSACS